MVLICINFNFFFFFSMLLIKEKKLKVYKKLNIKRYHAKCDIYDKYIQ